ncbi:MAG: hypothetical protein ABIG61_00425 [Planctomycetota bacterium]
MSRENQKVERVKNKDFKFPFFDVRVVPVIDGLQQFYRLPVKKQPFVMNWKVDSGPQGVGEFGIVGIAETGSDLVAREKKLLSHVEHFELRLADMSAQEPVVTTTTELQVNLEELWGRLADGFVRYDVIAFDAKGNEIGSSLLHSFVKGAHPYDKIQLPKIEEGLREQIQWIGEERQQARHIRSFEMEIEIADEKLNKDIESLEVQIASLGGTVSFKCGKENVDVAEIWDNIAPGFCRMRIQGLDAQSRTVAVSRQYCFTKGYTFDGQKQKTLDYKEYIERIARYLLSYRTPMAYEPEQPTCLWHSSTDEWGSVSPGSYPIQFENAVEAFLLYYHWQDAKQPKEGFAEAKRIVDWTLDHRSTEDSAAAGLPCTTASKGQLGGRVEGQRLSLNGAATTARTYVWMYHETGDEKYLNAAEQVADTLLKFQKPDGSWPWRINMKTGEITDHYSSLVLEFIRLFELLVEIKSNDKYSQARDKALAWMLENPVKTYRWEGYFCDDPGGNYEKYEQYSKTSHFGALWVGKYLLDHLEENLDYLSIAVDISDWVENHYVVHGEEMMWQEGIPANQPHTPAMIEEPSYRRTVTGHPANWLGLLLKLYEATGENLYVYKAIACANAITYSVLADGSVAPEHPDVVMNRRNEGEALWFWNGWYSIKGYVELEEFLQKHPQFRS